jgi:hypothetical protein
LLETGVREVTTFGEIAWADFFRENPGDIDICVSYGATWANQHAGMVIDHAAQGGHRVRLSVLDTRAATPAHLLEEYAETYETEDVASLIARVDTAIDEWRSQVARARGQGRKIRVTIERIRTHIPSTFYRAGASMWFVFSKRQRGRVGAKIPALRCEKTGTPQGLFEWVESDLEACRRQGLAQVEEEL